MFLRKILVQDGQDLAQETKILSKRPNLAQDLAQVLRQDPGQDFGSHNLGILDKILGKSGQEVASLGQVLGKSWASLGQVVLRKNYLLGRALVRVCTAHKLMFAPHRALIEVCTTH